MSSRLSPLDASFLALETPAAHMHIAWRGRFSPPPGGVSPTLEQVRSLVTARLSLLPRFRQRLAFPPGGFGAPVWVDHQEFDVDHHVLALAPEAEPLGMGAFAELCDHALSQPLDRRAPLWRILYHPRLADGSVGLLMQMHHAMVDGVAAVSLATLLLDTTPENWVPEEGAATASPRPAPGAARLAADAVFDAGAEPLRAALGVARLAASGSGRARIADTLRRTALAVGEDVLRPASHSWVNGQIGARRTLAGHTAELAPLRAVARVHDASLNDAVLAVVAGALRQVALARNLAPAPLKALVPVNMRAEGEEGGNRIAFVTVDLPLHRSRASDRLREVRDSTRAFKAAGRHRGGEALLDALALLPRAVQVPAARLAASPRAYNVVVSNVPGPPGPVYLLGCESIEAYPVVPISEGHALAIGILSLDGRLCFGAYADPGLLPEAHKIPCAISQSILELGATKARAAGRPSARDRAAHGPRSAAGRGL